MNTVAKNNQIVEAKLVDASGKEVFSKTLKMSVGFNAFDSMTLEQEVSASKLWSNETTNLYTLL